MGEVIRADFMARQHVPKETSIDGTANLAATIGLCDGRISADTMAELKEDLTIRLRSLSPEERAMVEKIAQQKIDERLVSKGEQ